MFLEFISILKRFSVLTFFLLFFCNFSYAQDKTITLATDPWAPYYDPKLKNNGYITHIAQEAFKRKGYTLKIDFVPWKRAFEYAKKGDYDGLLGAFYTVKRTAFFEYSKPIDSAQIVFFAKKEKAIKYKDLKSLKEYTIGVVRGYHYSEDFDKATYLNTFTAAHTKDNLKLLLHDRLDLLVGSKKVTLDLINKYYKKHKRSIEYLTPALVTNELYIPITKKNKNHKKIVNDFNEGLKEIRKDGTYEKILKEHGY